MYSMTQELSLIRADISAIDEQILKLLEQRMWCSVEVARYKIAHGLPVFDAAREAELLEKYSEKVDFSVEGIFQAIMDESKRVQQTIVSR